MTIKTLNGKKCLITGAASGIGRAVALASGREGAELFLTDVNAAGLEQTVRDVRAAGGSVAMASAFDIADANAVEAFAAETRRLHGSMDVLMNVAGIAIWGAIESLPLAQWQRVININLMGPVHVMRAFLGPMIEARRGGHLVNVSSAAGLFGLPWHAAYSASKFGLRGISEVLRFDLARHRIGVSLVCPGAVNTGLVQTVQVDGIDMNHPEALKLRKHFQGHAQSPERAAAAILRGIKRNRYMVYTSWDIRIGFWFQRKFAWPYEWVMRILNAQLYKISRRARLGGPK